MVAEYRASTRAETPPNGGPIHRDTPLSLTTAAREWARMTGTKRPHRATLLRWCTKGCRGVRLVAERVGNGWAVTPGALAEFHRRLNSRPASVVPIGAGPTRINEIARALRDLDTILGTPGNVP